MGKGSRQEGQHHGGLQFEIRRQEYSPGSFRVPLKMTFNLPETTSSHVTCQTRLLSPPGLLLVQPHLCPPFTPPEFYFALTQHKTSHHPHLRYSITSALDLLRSSAFVTPGRRGLDWTESGNSGTLMPQAGKTTGESLGNITWALGHLAKNLPRRRRKRNSCSQVLKEMSRETRGVSLRENTAH